MPSPSALPLDQAAYMIAAARIGRAPLDLLPEAIRPADEAGAYALQAAVHQRLAKDRYGRRIGWKIGCTTPVMQTYLGIPNPCGAGLFEGTKHRSGATVSAADFCHVGIECEIAVKLSRDLPAQATPYRAEDVAGAVESVMAAIELVDDRYADWRKTDTPTLIADDFFAAGCVLGEPLSPADAPDLAEVVGVTTINDIEVGRGRGADVLGHPFAALAWLANNLLAQGEMLRAGEIVLTGSLVETRWLNAGDRVAIAISGLGEVTLTVSE
jgi:2-keto-4-pentenoate hydratase